MHGDPHPGLVVLAIVPGVAVVDVDDVDAARLVGVVLVAAVSCCSRCRLYSICEEQILRVCLKTIHFFRFSRDCPL